MLEDLWIVSGKREERSRARRVICKDCGKEILVRLNKPHCGYCQSCNAKIAAEKNITTGINIYRRIAYELFEKNVCAAYL